MIAFQLLFPASMIVMPALLFGLWCRWTGVRAARPILVATLALLAGYAALAFLATDLVLRSQPLRTAFSLASFMGLIWIFAVPGMRRAVAALPPAPRAASLRRRDVTLPRFAWSAPAAAWAAIVAWLALGGARSPLWWVGAVVGGVGLVLLRVLLPRMVLEPEPLGGPDPEALARRYEEFRTRRVRGMYWLMVPIQLLVAASGALPITSTGGAIGGLLGGFGGLLGALFGTWADAQRYLLRRQLSGAPPPRG